MGRLIDAGLVLDNLSGRLESMKDYDAVKDVINNMPTAYDVDKVVEQLETEDSKIEIQYENNYEKGLLDGIGKAIEIVKGGGVDAKTDS
nr:MAG TPA: Cyclin-dependent kinase 9 [Caudoviricetes sp.]